MPPRLNSALFILYAVYSLTNAVPLLATLLAIYSVVDSE